MATAQTKCLQTAREVAPQLSEETRRDFETKLAEARADFEKSPSAENYIWLGRRTAYLGRYKEAVSIYTDGIKKFPADARLFRHLGHRLITLRCFDDAIESLETAAFWSNGTSDQIEPDGLPNERNIPTSTLQSNIWYHLGLARYLKGDFRGALKAYRAAEKLSKNPDMLVATTHWLYMTLRRLGRTAEAKKSIAGIPDNLDIIENADYYRLIKFYQGKLKPADLLGSNQSATTLSNATVGYGVGNWFLYHASPAEAEKIFRQVVSGNQWASFGYIAAEAELTQRRGWQISSPPNKSFSVLVPVPLRRVAWVDGEHAATLQADQSASWAQCYSAIETTPEVARFGVIVVDNKATGRFTPATSAKVTCSILPGY